VNTKLVNSAAGVVMAALQQNRTAAGIALALESAQMLMTPETAAELERLASQVVELQSAMSEHKDDAARARRERDLMRERVSEPFGCTYCGIAQRSHGRQWIASAGVHAWERPSDEQVKARMLARRVARSPLPATPELDQVLEDLTGANLARWEEEQDNARLRLALKAAQRGRRELRARIAELEAERHSTNEALDDAVQALRADRAEPAEGPSADESADRLTQLFAPTQALRVEAKQPGACDACGDAAEQWCPDCAACEKGCFGSSRVGEECSHANAPWTKTEAVPPRVHAMRALLDGQRAAVEDPHDSPLHHSYHVPRDRPEMGGAR
jgi:hypothetical protein